MRVPGSWTRDIPSRLRMNRSPPAASKRNPRFITLRRGGTLADTGHRRLATWAAACAEHVLPPMPLLPVPIRALVLDDQKRRNQKCWSLFED